VRSNVKAGRRVFLPKLCSLSFISILSHDAK
jgi:hypothetical protein